MKRDIKVMQLRPIEAVDVMRYYVTYQDIEKQIISDIKENNPAIREKAYNKYVHQHMKIGRNFRSKTGHMVLAATKNHLNSGNSDVIALSNIYATNDLLNNRNKNALVASSKMLWLFTQNVIIMDRLNMKLLRANDYNNYVTKWSELFMVKEPEIEQLIDKHFKKLDPVMDERWFRMRVFDQFLWTIGKP